MLQRNSLYHSKHGSQPHRTSSANSVLPGRTGQRSRCFLKVAAQIRARWCLDARYGYKTEATALLQEWVRDVGSTAGATASNTRLSSGYVGAPESRLELEVAFGSLAEWEGFLAAIPFAAHKAWSQRAQGRVVDGSPRWEVYRVVPVDLAGEPQHAASTSAVQGSNAVGGLTRGSPVASSVSAAGGASSSSSAELDFASTILQALQGAASSGGPAAASAGPGPGPGPGGVLDAPDDYYRTPARAPAPDASGSGSGSVALVEGDSAAQVVLDWKGDPMVVNPGDKLPFKFL